MKCQLCKQDIDEGATHLKEKFYHHSCHVLINIIKDNPEQVREVLNDPDNY